MFKNRTAAGQMLAEELSAHVRKKDAIVLGIPRGGIVVAGEVARKLSLPLDMVVIKKIGIPGNEELAAGATGHDSYVLNESIVQTFNVSDAYIQAQVRKKQLEVKAYYKQFRANRPPYPVKGKTVLLIDDGIATGATMIMAVRIIRKESPKEVIAALPVAPPDTVKMLEKIADKVVCLRRPHDLKSIGQFYDDFTQVPSQEAKRILASLHPGTE